MDEFSFDRLGPEQPQCPVIISVPHAGRIYPPGLLQALIVPPEKLIALEDRFIDAVAVRARHSETVFVQRTARAWIDLNRAETDRDPLVEQDTQFSGKPSLRARSGLALIPRRAGSTGRLWRTRFTATDIDHRIICCHRPYHDALGKALALAKERFGVAVVIDLHSMPPLHGSPNAARIVLGDRFGTSAAGAIVEAAGRSAEAAGFAVALNAPYAGGHLIERHGHPARDIHAIQVEIDRSLYLDRTLDQPGPGLMATVALLRRMIDAVIEQTGTAMFAKAAE